jgi:hypothetical protein
MGTVFDDGGGEPHQLTSQTFYTSSAHLFPASITEAERVFLSLSLVGA